MALDNALAQVNGIRDYHLEQNSRKSYKLELMIKSDTKDSDRGVILDEARGALESLYGRNGEYDIIISPNILPGPAGKFRRTQANFDFDLKRLFA
jgi:hypothetical protein